MIPAMVRIAPNQIRNTHTWGMEFVSMFVIAAVVVVTIVLIVEE